MKAAAVLPVGMLYCCVGSDGTMRGCTDQLERDGGGCYARSGCDGGCWVMK